MIVIPAIDLRDGACVQLVGGSYQAERVRLDNPLDVARGWAQYGFQRLHVVDLDAATGRGSNSAIVRELLSEQPLPVQVGGGVRTTEAVEQMQHDGARWVVVGTRALDDPGWLEDSARAFPETLIVAVDVRDRQIVTHGWARGSRRAIFDTVDELNALELAAIMVTAVHLEGQLMGTDLRLMEEIAEISSFPVFAAGGITTVADIRALDERGVAGAIIGMALYTGALDPWVVAEEFSE